MVLPGVCGDPFQGAVKGRRPVRGGRPCRLHTWLLLPSSNRERARTSGIRARPPQRGQSFPREGLPALHLRVFVALAVVVLDVAHDADRAVVAGAAVLDVITRTTVERVVAGVALQVVVAVIPLQVIGTAAALEGVVAVIALELVVPIV